MATITFIIVAILYLEAASQLVIDPVIIPTDGTQICPSQEDLRILNNALTTLANFSLVPECGAGLWKRVAYLNMSDPSQ